MPPRHLRVFVSMPGDLPDERAAVARVLHTLQHGPLLKGLFTFEAVSWNDPDAPAYQPSSLSPQQAIDRALPKPSDCDLVVVAFWGRFGTPLAAPRRSDGSPYLSGTEYEYESARGGRVPILLYRRTAPPLEPDPEQRARVAGFFERARHPDGTWLFSYTEYETAADFDRRFALDVQSFVRDLGPTTYAREVCESDPYLRSAYVPLHARGRANQPEKVHAVSAGRPQRPKIYNVVRRSPQQPSAVIEEKFDDVGDAVAACGGSAVVLGEPGAGKSTALRRLKLVYGEQALRDATARIPVLAVLGEYDGRVDVSDFIRQQLERAVGWNRHGEEVPLPAHRALADLIPGLLARERLIVLFDGLNEIARDSQSTAAASLRNFVSANPGNRFVFTCREREYDRNFQLPEIRIEPLDDAAIQAFAHGALGEAAGRFLNMLAARARALWEIARNPYALQLMVSLFEDHGTLPANRAALFSEFVFWSLHREHRLLGEARFAVAAVRPEAPAQDRLLGELGDRFPTVASWRHDPERFGLAELSDRGRRSFLLQSAAECLALARFAFRALKARHGTAIPSRVAMEILAEPLSVDGTALAVAPDTVLQLAASAGLLEYSKDSVRFRHQLLQEYFAAVHLSTLDPDNSEIAECVRRGSWDETLLLMAGIVRDPSPLVERLTPFDAFLAAECCGVNPNAISPAVAETLVAELRRHARDVYGPWRGEAVTALSRSHLSSALTVLEDLLGDPSLDQGETLRAIGELGLPESFELLRVRLRNEQRDLTRVAIARALDAAGNPAVVDVILEQLEHGANDLRTSLAGPILERHTTSADGDRFMALLSSENQGLRWAAMRVLSHLGDARAIPRLIALVQSEAGAFQETAMKALAALGARQAIPVLAGLLDKRLTGDRGHAPVAEALVSLVSADDEEMLVGWIGHPNRWRRSVVYEVAGRLGFHRAGERLLQHLATEEFAHFRELLARSLDQLGILTTSEDREVTPFEPMELPHGDAGVGSEPRATACLLFDALTSRSTFWTDRPAARLSSVPPNDILEVLRPLRDHPDWWIRNAAIRAHEEVSRKADSPRENADALPRRRQALETVAGMARRAFAVVPGYEPAALLGPAALRRLGRPAEAIEMLDSFPVADRGTEANVGGTLDRIISLERARCLADLARRAEATAVVRKLAADRDAPPTELPDSHLLAQCAEILSRLDANKEARRVFDRAVHKAHPHGFYRHRAAFFIGQGRYAEAEYDMKRAAGLEREWSDRRPDPERWHPDTVGQPGLLALAQGQFDAAFMAFEDAMRRDPHGFWEFGLALALEGLGRSAEADQLLGKSLPRLELNEDVAWVHGILQLFDRVVPDPVRAAAIRARIDAGAGAGAPEH